MKIKIPKDKLDDETKKKLGVDSWRGALELNLASLKPDLIDKLQTILTPLKKEKGMTKVLRTISAFKAIRDIPPDQTCQKAKTVEAYYTGMKKILAAMPGKRLYKLGKDGINGAGRADGYYIEKMSCTPRQHIRHRGYEGEPGWTEIRPGYITLLLCYITDRGLQCEEENFYERDLFGKHPFVAISNDGWTIETPELKAQMIAERKLWHETRNNIGLQLRGEGLAELLPERNEDEDRHSFWYYRSSVEIKLDKDGPAPLVIDVKKEGEKSSDEDEEEEVLKKFAGDFWTNGDLTEDELKFFKAQEEANKKVDAKAKKSDEDGEEEDDDDDSDIFEDDNDIGEEDGEEVTDNGLILEQSAIDSFGPIAELPVHPWITCFNLRGHQRVRLHMSQTSLYAYNTTAWQNIVIETDSRLLIQMLLHQREQFKDVIEKKGGGAVILCAGPPGTGKTLTSEIFAEAEKRPLYSVQCSQLGTSADELEKNLLKIFARASRWKAILLLDEADVYIAKRGSDMNQNAIVGVFLRVLEYYNGVMFMTTNRADSVDDAVLSRCVARIDYTNPSEENQVKIWHILAKTSNLNLAAGTAERVAKEYSLSGRDVKQILKLSALVAHARKKTEIDYETIIFCLRYKPTERIAEGQTHEAAHRRK